MKRVAVTVDAGQPQQPPAVHYVPTRCLADKALEAFRNNSLTPIEQMTEQDVLTSSIQRLRTYINVYQAKITGCKSPKFRADYDNFFRLWFRHMYDKGQKQQRLSLPVYVPPAHPRQQAHAQRVTAPYVAFTPLSDPGYMRLRPLRPHPIAPHYLAPVARSAIGEDSAGNRGLQMDSRIASLVRSYGLFGRAWNEAGNAMVLSACDFLSTWGKRIERQEVATEAAAELCEALADVATHPLVHYGPHVEMDTLLASVRQAPLLSGGMCWRLARNDRSGIRQV